VLGVSRNAPNALGEVRYAAANTPYIILLMILDLLRPQRMELVPRKIQNSKSKIWRLNPYMRD
jgi:hypothetical protein